MRYKIVTDNDGHDYVILAEMEDEFYKWVESTEDDEYPEYGSNFDNCRVTLHNLTFTDPQGWK